MWGSITLFKQKTAPLDKGRAHQDTWGERRRGRRRSLAALESPAGLRRDGFLLARLVGCDLSRVVAELGLVGHLLLGLFDLIRVTEEVAAQEAHGPGVLDGLQVLVQVVHQRDPGGDLEPRDVLVADVVQHLDDAADRVAVRRDEHLLPALEGRADAPVVVRQAALHRVLKALGERELLLANVRVFVVVARPVLGVGVDFRRRGRKAPAPLLHLVLAVLLHRLPLVQPGEAAVHALVQAPVGIHGHVLLPRDLENNLQSLLRTLEKGGEGDVDEDTLLPHLGGAHRSLILPERGERHVRPPGEEVGLVPLALPVAHDHQRGVRLGRHPRSHAAGAEGALGREARGLEGGG
mmetsp:Transcript_15767/g.36596  ORF Transcript_15767/g.36596 Transcript_15767/m.36596 type:complete len:350 (+) Transcript_15767:101-1150(+)